MASTAEEDLLISPEEEREDRRRKRKLLVALLLTLLAGMLVLILLWALLFMGPRPPRAIDDGVFKPVFSIYGLSRPFGVASDKDGNIYVADNGSRRLLVFDKDGNYSRRIGKDKGRTKFYSMDGLAVDDRLGRVYVTDFALRQILAFDLKGNLLMRFPEKPGDPAFGQLRFSPYDVDFFGQRIFVASNDGIYIFSKDGKLIQKWGGKGSDLGFFDFPNAVAIDRRTGDMYVGDVLNRRIVALDQQGKVRWAVGLSDLSGKDRSYFGLPRGIAVDGQGHIYVNDTFNSETSILDRDGNLLAVGGARGVEDGLFNFPEGIDVREDGTLVVADRENNRVAVLKMAPFDELPRLEPDARVKFNASLARPGAGGTAPVFVNIIDFQDYAAANDEPVEAPKDRETLDRKSR